VYARLANHVGYHHPMSVETISVVFAWLAVISIAGSVVLTVGVFTRGWNIQWAQPLSALVAIVATGGSLYYSESVGFVPCRFCWFQRIAMYPLAFMLTVEILSRRRLPRIQPILLGVIGAGISAYHYRLQVAGETSTSCEIDNPCSAKWIEVAGFMTLPAMAFCGFASIVILNLLAAREQH
jgi:disulfide bond formation protein DsbB